MKFFLIILSTLILSLIIFLFGCSNQKEDLQNEVQAYLDSYNKTYQKLYTSDAEAQWKLNTKIIEGDTLAQTQAQKTGEKIADFTGSKENIDKSKKYLELKDQLTETQVRELKRILYLAGNNPQTVTDVVKERIKAENEQVDKLFGYDFKVDGKSTSANEIDDVLKHSQNLNERLKVWTASKVVGKELKDGLENLRNLSNKTVQALGYKDYFDY
ncbi:MAG: M2 family metallopeptidase, partial [Ignavibacteriaceae bacterium]